MSSRASWSMGDTIHLEYRIRPRSAGPDHQGIQVFRYSGIHAVVAEDVVQRGRVVLAALGQPPEHQRAGHAELPAGELPASAAAHADRPWRDLAARQFLARLHIDDMRGLGEDQASTEDRAAAHP